MYDIMITKLTYLKLISQPTQQSQADSPLSKGIKGQSGQGDPIKLIRAIGMVSAWYFCTDPYINKTGLVSLCAPPFTDFGEILD